MKSLAIVIFALFFIVGCEEDAGYYTKRLESSNNSNIDNINQKQKYGYYIDSAVSGIDYICGDIHGATNNQGKFKFYQGNSCKFLVGDIALREVESSKLYGGVIIQETNLSIARILQTLDKDGNPDKNGIEIASNSAKCLKESFNGDSIPNSITDDNIDRLYSCLKEDTFYVGRAVTEREALAHIKKAIDNDTTASTNNASSQERSTSVDNRHNDRTSTIITLKGDNPFILEAGDDFIDPGATLRNYANIELKVNGIVSNKTVGDYTITYVAKDNSGNKATKTRTVKVVDTTPPTITLKGASLLSIQQGMKFNDPGVDTSDNANGDIKVTVDGRVDISTVGEYTLKYTATDESGNKATVTRVVKVLLHPDTTPPIITLKGCDTLKIEAGSNFIDSGATAIDDVDGDVNVVVDGTVNSKKVGTYTIVYSSTDSSGNKATKKRVVKVVDTTSPTIALKGASLLSIEQDVKFNDPGVDSSDNADGDIKVTVDGSVDISTVGEYILIYTATDKSGNKSTVTRVVKVILQADTTPPTITIKGDNPLTLEAGSDFVDSGATAIDDVDGDVNVVVDGTVNSKKIDTYTITYTSTDSSGNKATKTRTVNVVDTTPPTITLKGDAEITLHINDNYIEQGVETSDNVTGDVNVTISGTVDSSKIGEYTLTYTAKDKAGNIATITRDVKVVEELENLMHVTNESNVTKRVKTLGMGSGGSHHLLFHHSDGKTVIENGDMGAMSISHDGGETFQQLVSNVHAKDIGSGAEKYTLPRLMSIVEHPTHPDWLFGVASYGVLSFSTDRGKTWHSKQIGYGALIANKIVVRQEGDRVIAYFASGYKLGLTQVNFTKLGVWVDITDIPSDIKSFNRGSQYDVILYGKENPTGLYGKYYYGDIVNLQDKLFVVGKGGLFVSEGDPKSDDNWRNITDSIFEHKDGVYPLDNGVAIGNKLYVLAYGDNDDTNNTAGVYVHTKGDISDGKYNFSRIYKGLNLARFHSSKGNRFTRLSGALLKHIDTSTGKTYLYLIMQDVVYRLNITDNSDRFEQVTETASVNGKTYSKGFILGQRNTEHWSIGDNGSYTSFTDSYQFGKMSFATSYFPSFSGLNTAYSYGGKIYVANTIEIKVSSDNGKTFNSYTSRVSNTGSEYDGKIKWYYGDISIYEDGFHDNSHKINISPTDDSVSFWWSSVKNRGMDNMVSTDIAINPNNPKEMMQTYMDSAAFFSDDAGESWHYTAGLRGLLGDVYWTQWIKDSFYAQDRSGIYRFNKDKLEFERLRDINIHMYIEESVRVRRYYDKKSDTLILAGYEYGVYNAIWVIKHFTDENLREVKHIRDSRKQGNGVQFTNWPGISRSFKDVYCDGEYVYAINSELGVIKMPLDNLPDNYNDFTFGLDKDEHVFSGLFDRDGNAMLVTANIEKLDDDDSVKVEKDYALKYSKLIYSTKPFELKKVDIVSESNTTIIPRGNGLNIDGKEGVASGKSMLTLLGIDPKNSDRVLASIASTKVVIESKDGGKTWSEFLPQISGNSHGSQSGNALFAPTNSLYDVIILGNGSAYGVLKSNR